MHWILAMWATLTGYTPISYWIAQHRQHHRVADTAADIHSPVNGIAKSFIFWTLDASAIKSIFFERASVVSVARALKDPAINFFNRSFLLTNLIFLIILTAIDYQLLFAAAAAYALEQFRIGSINTCLHLARFPGNYTNHSLSNNSQNNYVLGIITFGFGWHNNHHADAKKLILSEKWWEIDLEGYLGWVLSKTAKQ